MQILRRNREPVLSALVLLFVAFLVGAMLGRLSVLTMREKVVTQVAEELQLLADGNVDYTGLFRYTVMKNAVIFATLIFATVCIVGPWYYLFRVGRFGLVTGFLAGQFGGLFHGKGLLLTGAYFLPAWVVYVPVYISLYRTVYDIWRMVFRKQNAGEVLLSKREYLQRLCVSLLLLEFGAVLEVWLGSLILRLAAGHFVTLL